MLVSDEEREALLRVFTHHLSREELTTLLPSGIHQAVVATEGPVALGLSRDVAELLLELFGTEILSRADVREKLLETVTLAKLKDLRDQFAVAADTRSQKRLAAVLAQRKWYAGRDWAKAVTAVLELPEIFAGSRPSFMDAPFEDIVAYQQLPPLYDYQEDACSLIERLIQNADEGNRAILSLPTGAGKTRTVVQGLLRVYAGRAFKGSLLLWIAQSEELCEQAVGTFRRVWTCFGAPGESLRIYRLWGARDLPDTAPGGVVVASIQKLYVLANRADDTKDQLSDLGRELGAVVIDEAHHAIAPSYSEVLRTLGYSFVRRQRSSPPLIGLTATPYRGAGVESTEELTARFNHRLLVPEVLRADPVGLLQQRGILARTDHKTVEVGGNWEMTPAELEHLRIFGDFAESFIRRLGQDGRRNQLIIQNLMRLDPTWPILFFGCSKEHAVVTSALLRRKGIRAAAVTSDTSRVDRRAIVEGFKQSDIRVLCNYGIFTTGFDAPNVRAVVVARPTTSAVLYEQMVGRGLRGPKNGGTPEVLIMDFSDNLERFGHPMAHTRFQEYWRWGKKSY